MIFSTLFSRTIFIGLILVAVIFSHTLDVSALSRTSSSLSIFRELGIELIDPIADTYYAGDSILIRGRVTDKQPYALIYVKNLSTGESLSDLAETDKNGLWNMPVVFPGREGKYSLIIASGNSFNTTLNYPITLVANQTLAPLVSPRSTIPTISYNRENSYISVAPSTWSQMLITQGSRTSTTQGSIISLKNIPLRYGPAKVVVSSYKTTTPSSLDRILTDGYVWTGSIYIDRIRDVIGADRVSIRKVRGLATIQFQIPLGKKVQSKYYITTPSGDVIESGFAPQYIDRDGYLKTGVTIRSTFSIMDAGVYKVEAVSDNGYAYFNIPLSRSVFWSVVAPVTPMDISTFRTDSSTVETSLISSINSLRIGLGRLRITRNTILTDLAERKALDMATHDYVGHTTHTGLDLIEFAQSQSIKITGTIGENVAGGNVSDISLQDGLEESGSHRANMIDPDWGSVGIGYVIRNGKSYLVQIFGK